MLSPRTHLPAIAALVTTGAFLGAWWTIPAPSEGVQASTSRSPMARSLSGGAQALPSGIRGPARLSESDRQRPNAAVATTGVLDLQISGLAISPGATSHAMTVARLTRLNPDMISTAADWSSTAEVIAGIVAFGGVPVDRHFELLLTGPEGEELLRTTVLGPGHGLSPDYASVRVSLGR